MFIQKKKEARPTELPTLVSIDYMSKQSRETTKSAGNSIRNALLPPEAVKNAAVADISLAVAKNGQKLNLRELPKNLLGLIKGLA